jgi:hypothetical protein
MTMLGVIRWQCARTFDRTEALREVGLVHQSFELRLEVRIVIQDVRAAVGIREIKIDQQLRDGFGAHAGAAIAMQGPGTRRDVLFIDRISSVPTLIE